MAKPASSTRQAGRVLPAIRHTATCGTNVSQVGACQRSSTPFVTPCGTGFLHEHDFQGLTRTSALKLKRGTHGTSHALPAYKARYRNIRLRRLRQNLTV